MLAAVQSGNAQAFAEAVRQFDLSFGLDKDKLGETVREFNESLALSAAAQTGQYQGAPTLPALTSYATQFGQWGVPQTGAQTLAAQAQNAGLYGFNPGLNAQGVPIGANGQPLTTLAAQQQTYTQQMGAINAAAALQANPFRQQQVLGQLGQVLGGGGVAAFQAPNTVAGVGTVGQAGRAPGGWVQGQPQTPPEGTMFAQDMVTLPNGQTVSREQAYRAGWTQQPSARVAALGGTGGGAGGGGTGMGYLQQMIDDIRDPTANQTSMNQVLQGIPTPNKVNSVEFSRAAPSTQSMVLQGMQEKYGLDPKDALAQINATLPQFQSPTTMGTLKR
jgi:hypothetical protein